MYLTKGHTLQNGKYRIEKKIGQGGFGITYLAFMRMTVQGEIGAMDTEIPVVVKEFFWNDYCSREAGASIVSIGSVTGNEMFARFKEKLKKEAKILSRLTHPNIVRVLYVFEENNTAYMVMQLIEGESLKDKIARLGRIDETTVLKYTRQLCAALTEVHAKAILHLDIKPSNVIIDNNDNALLLDFGISKQYDNDKHETSTTPVGISKGYAPIEQYSGIEKFNPPTDVYALGATLYTMLTGLIPLEAPARGQFDLAPVTGFNPDVSKQTDEAISKAMNEKSRDRFQTIQEFWQALHKEDKISSETKDILSGNVSNEAGPDPSNPDNTTFESQDNPPPPTNDGKPPRPLDNDPPSPVPWNKVFPAIAVVLILALLAFFYYNSQKSPPTATVIPETPADSIDIVQITDSTENVTFVPQTSPVRAISTLTRTETINNRKTEVTNANDSSRNETERREIEEADFIEQMRLAEEQRQREQEIINKVAASFGLDNTDDGSQGNGIAGSGNERSPFDNSNTGVNTDVNGISGTFNIFGRIIRGSLPRPNYTTQDEGTIVVNITVAPRGNVILAEIGRGTNIDNMAMRASVLDAARRTKFNSIQSDNNQTGTITYRFTLK